MKNRFVWVVLFLVVVLVVALWVFSRTGNQVPQNLLPSSSPFTTQSEATVSATLGVQTKTTDCHVNGALPDPSCTPGAVFPNATKEQICTRGYAKSVRDVPGELKDQVYQEYGIKSHTTGQYEVDHLISLELGGSNDISNLWPEVASPQPGFHEKDKVENYLHDQVCNGQISLQKAQQEISTNWQNIYDSMK